MSDEDEIELTAPPPPEIVQFFSGEANPEFIATAELETLVAFYASVKLTSKQAGEHRDRAGARIKELLKADSIEEKKSVQKVGKWSVIISRREGACKIDYEKYIEDHIGPEALKELAEMKDLVKRGKGQSKYVTQADESVVLEVL